MKYDYLIFIGRFQPFHNGHKYVIEKGLKISKKIIILCGSVNQKRNMKNPFNYYERKKCVLESFNEVIFKKLYIKPVDNYLDDKIWVKCIKKKVEEITGSNFEINIGIIGYNKDATSYYMKLFSAWPEIEVNNFQNLDASYIRKVMITAKNTQEVICKIEHLVPKRVLVFLVDFLKSKYYLKFKEEYINKC